MSSLLNFKVAATPSIFLFQPKTCTKSSLTDTRPSLKLFNASSLTFCTNNLISKTSRYLINRKKSVEG
jgi:hypothetical protein